MPRNYAVHGKRAMLNLPGHQTTAAIVAEIQDTKNTPAERHPYITLQFSNCDRSISFDMIISNEEAYENTLYKVDTMIDALRSLRRGMVTERKRMVSRQGG